LFDYDYTYTVADEHYPYISDFADGTAVFANFKKHEAPDNEPVNYYFFNSSGQLLFEKVGPTGQYLNLTVDGENYGPTGGVKQFKDSAGKVYYTLTGNKDFDTYDGQGNKICSGKPAFAAPVGFLSTVTTSPMASDKPTNEIYYVNSFPLAFESNGNGPKPFTSRTILTFDMLTCQQTKSKTITLNGPTTNLLAKTRFHEVNGRVYDFHLDIGINNPKFSYFETATQTLVELSASKAFEMLGPVLRNGSIVTQGIGVTVQPWLSEGYYLFNVYVRDNYRVTDVFSIMGHNVSPSPSGFLPYVNDVGPVELWGIARLDANGKLQVSKAINAAN
jgi:hypothetical protein